MDVYQVIVDLILLILFYLNIQDLPTQNVKTKLGLLQLCTSELGETKGIGICQG